MGFITTDKNSNISIYTGSVTINNYGSHVPPPEQPPHIPVEKNNGWLTFLSICFSTAVTLFQAANNGWMMVLVIQVLVMAGVTAGAAPLWATGIIAFSTCAAPTVIFSVVRWVYNKTQR
ncbi:TPA: hypothetical protein RKY22_004904 [Klebsiella michiganensis]|uniref:hypothetical protein n=1 Tax=Klebsiella quasipneumoniae TaxID=1463165 RepID=UPI0010DB235D|nr:hypothetical protein [Klebsiella quasipneumoniae]UDC52439.1 hypothetical protein LGM29_29205 [Klebsiella quasipneumoniae subsp. similipneumoniae]VGO91155.1 hypothetical protein SB00610_00151 [Klebsiella quasipneumoniae subsp. similipneumoniae]HDW0214321.1 hypothetical protein [Klebsiella michiganensis]